MPVVAICGGEGGNGLRDGVRVKAKIRAFGSTGALCRKLEAGGHRDLIFLDINFPKSEVYGAEARRLIREAHSDCGVSIVCVSWEKGRALDLFETGHWVFC